MCRHVLNPQGFFFSRPWVRLQASKGSTFLRSDNRASLGGGVGLLVGGLPLGPRVLGERHFVPTFGFVRVVVGGHHGPDGRGDKDGITDEEVELLFLRLGFLHNVDVVRYAFGFLVKIHHLTLDDDGVVFVETAVIFVEVREERRGGHLGIEGYGVLKLLIPYLIGGGLDEVNAAFVGAVL